MKKRLPTAIILVLVLTPLLIFDKVFILSEILFAFLAIFASYELFKLTSYKNKPAMFLIPSITTTLNYLLISHVFVKAPQIDLQGIVYPSFIVILITFMLSSMITLNMDNSDVKYYKRAMLYPGIGFGSLLLIRNFGVKYILFIIAITTLTDTFAYFTGRLFGRTKLAPKVSPNKTVEGLLGGTFTATLFVVPFFFFYDKIFYGKTIARLFNNDGGNIFNIMLSHEAQAVGNFMTKVPYQVIILLFFTILLSLFGQLGDLYASKMKREKNIKDYSNIFPGHGGVLDRFDSLLFVAPAFLILILFGGALSWNLYYLAQAVQ